MPLRWLGDGWAEVRRIAWLGSPLFVLPAVLAVAVVAYARRDDVGVAICVVGPALAGLCELAGKPVVGRLKGDQLSYPSGHCTLAAALAALIVVIAYRLAGARAAAIAVAPAALIPLLVAIAVVRLGWHYPTDAVGGVVLGVGVVCATAVVVPRLYVKNRTN
jgi:undecaprenyl-diphosphatase